MATLNDIAQALGVSKSTVSKALNNADDVGDATKHAIIEKAVELGYKRRTYNKSLPNIAVFVTNMEYKNPGDFGYDILMGFKKESAVLGYRIDVIPIDNKFQKAESYDSYMVQHNYCAGFFLGLSLLDPWQKDFKTCVTPTVLYDNHITDNPKVTQVGIDNIDGMRIAISYLMSLGHKKIGYLGNALGAYVYRQRMLAYLQSLREQNIDVDMDIVGTAFYLTDCLSKHLPRLLNKGCTAIICSHDMLASSVMTHCTELGLSIPKDLSIMGFDDLPICEFTIPPLTTIRQDRTEIGKSAFYALTSQLNNVPISSILLHPKLIERSSCTGLN